MCRTRASRFRCRPCSPRRQVRPPGTLNRRRSPRRRCRGHRGRPRARRGRRRTRAGSGNVRWGAPPRRGRARRASTSRGDVRTDGGRVWAEGRRPGSERRSRCFPELTSIRSPSLLVTRVGRRVECSERPVVDGDDDDETFADMLGWSLEPAASTGGVSTRLPPAPPCLSTGRRRVSTRHWRGCDSRPRRLRRHASRDFLRSCRATRPFHALDDERDRFLRTVRPAPLIASRNPPRRLITDRYRLLRV